MRFERQLRLRSHRAGPRKILCRSSTVRNMRRYALSLAVLAVAASAPARAQIAWTGNTSDDWFTGTNWSGNAVPLATQNVIIDTIVPNPTVVRLPSAVVNNLTIGSVATGSLTIIDGGMVTTNNLARIAFEAGSQGEVTVTGSGSMWTNATSLSVANAGTGRLLIEAGGQVITSANGLIGQLPGSTGAVDVFDAGSTWSQGGSLVVGQGGLGTLTVASGGTVTNVDGRIGENAGAMGKATVDAATWTNAGTFFVGNAGSGELIVVNGGTVSNTEGRIGFQAGSMGAVMVSGPGSSWNSSLDLEVGTAGVGTLSILAGGIVVDRDGRIGMMAGSLGTVKVSDAGSTWNNDRNLVIGGTGQGALTIANDGVVNVAGTTTVASAAGSTGTLNIGTAPAGAPVAPGTLNSATVGFGAGTGTINFNHTASDYVFAPAIGGAGAVNALAGTTIFTGANTYSGPTLIDGATLQAGAVNAFSPNSEHAVTSAAILDLAGLSQTVLG
jgi:T5SS/PEP-CTERM-associated repeat protein/autotransporter-associated beta strand protein